MKIIHFYVFIFFVHSISLYAQTSKEIFNEVNHIASRHVHGFINEGMSYEDAKMIIDAPKLEMSCGSICEFAIQYLSEKGVNARFILSLTLEEWNSYNNGHSMIEIREGDKWTLWDLDLKNIFVKKGKKLNAIELLENPDYEIIRFNRSDIFSESGIHTMEKYGLNLTTPEGIREFYKRCFQVILIKENGNFYFTCDKNDIKRIESYPTSEPLLYIPPHEFIKTFYYPRQTD